MIRNSPIYLTTRAHDHYTPRSCSQPPFRYALPFISTGSNRNRYAASQLKEKKKKEKGDRAEEPERDRRSETVASAKIEEELETAPVFRDVAKREKPELSYG